jgi:hypothetical protein
VAGARRLRDDALGYVLGTCGAPDHEAPELVVDMLPRLDAPSDLPDGERRDTTAGSDRNVAGRRGYLNLNVALARDGAGWLECRFDPARFAPPGVRSLVGLALDRLTGLAPRRVERRRQPELAGVPVPPPVAQPQAVGRRQHLGERARPVLAAEATHQDIHQHR